MKLAENVEYQLGLSVWLVRQGREREKITIVLGKKRQVEGLFCYCQPKSISQDPESEKYFRCFGFFFPSLSWKPNKK